MKTVAVVGAFPPPVHGMAKNNLLFADEISDKARVLKLNTSGNSLQRGLRYHLTRATRSVRAAVLITLSQPYTVYMSMDGGLGITYNLLSIAAARLFAKKLIIHHRSFAYIDKSSLLARIATFISGRNCLHIFLCGCMRDRFCSIYKYRFRSMVVSNAKHTPPQKLRTHDSPIDSLTIGHLSNLSFEKGLKEVIETYEQTLKENRFTIKLILAGPVENEPSNAFLKAAMLRNPHGIKYLGPVYDKNKEAFYQSIDVFLFPTNYKNEAQPNVVFEALSHNIPVIATDRGCLGDDLQDNFAGTALDLEHFVSGSSKIIKDIVSDPGRLDRQRQAAHLFISKAHAQAARDHNELVREVLDEAN